MSSPPPLFPRTIFLTGPNQPPKTKQDSAVGSETRGPTDVENSQTNQIHRSQLRVSKKPLPPLPGVTSRSGTSFDDSKLAVRPDRATEADKDTEVTNTKGSQSLHWKVLPALPTCTSLSEHIYEEPNFITNSQQTQEDAKVRVSAHQPPPVPPKPLQPLQLPIIGPCAALDPQGSHADEAAAEKFPKSGRGSLPRPVRQLPPVPQKPVYPLECGQTPMYLDIVPDDTLQVEGSSSGSFHKPLPPLPKARPPTLNRNSQGSQDTRDADKSQDEGSSSGSFHKPLPPLPKARPPTLNRNSQGSQDTRDADKSQETDDLAEWWSSVLPWGAVSLEHGGDEEDETEIFHMKVNRIQRGIEFFLCLLKKHSGAFGDHINQLNAVADKFDKSSKSLKVRAITGGTTGALGGVATVTGIVLAPLTMGTSLVVTAVGVGAIAAGGVTGASAAILNKKWNNTGRKTVEKIVDEYRAEVEVIDQSLEFVAMGVSELEKHDVSRLMCDGDSLVVPTEVQLAVRNLSFIQAAARSSGILQGFAQHLDGCFPEEESQKTKKDSTNKYSTSVRELAQQLQDGLDDLNSLREIFSTAEL
ncbi:uncharacterized protein LOC125717536 isoform X1 [Brienomyrus brachyistius]|uniref:uncharacterized protein LOC125717536 isoform X1 n=1 Tax=Brienomyrus brachyistius TaxID=42636 RepID=UPI0020B2C867|nr:uncharacterized protein LOC125717536 isoform X1 [Brienomyrus brachyistius]